LRYDKVKVLILRIFARLKRLEPEEKTQILTVPRTEIKENPMELEVKILDIDLEHIRRVMEEAGAALVKDEQQDNLIYDFPDRRLLKAQGYARIRVVEDHRTKKVDVLMTTKRLISRDVVKRMEEFETPVSDRETGEGIFKALGLELIQNIRKTRESYQVKNSLVEIDINEKEFVPFPYLEVESPTVEELEEIVALLGYTMADTSSKSIFQILEERGLTPTTPKGL
jgi:adenylate cyclase class 2